MNQMKWIVVVISLMVASVSFAHEDHFQLTSPVMQADGVLPVNFTCDGDSITPPLAWENVPAGTVSYAILMDHQPENEDYHWYWIVLGIPSDITSIDAGTTVLGTLGTNSVNNQQEYAPPCSRGPGEKVYTFHIYALSAVPEITDPSTADREVLLTAIEDITLETADLSVVFDRENPVVVDDMEAIAAQEEQTDGESAINFEHYTITMPLSETGLDPACMGKDEAFLPFGDALAVHCDETFMYIEAFTFADHEMMVGITAWNGQVPLPHRLTDDNSWRILLNPELAEQVTPTVGQGPIAVAINGVMIFNPTRQDGIYSERSDPYLIGELDACGGHSGQGDDYHYHIAPVCLVEHLAEDSDGILPIAYAMDGFPIYGFTNVDGVTPDLDECNGEFDDDGNYHYHATETYPYINGCFKGAFDMSLQPSAHPIRPAGSPTQVLITALYQDDEGWVHMEYEYQGTLLSINYRELDDSCFEYEFVDNVETGEVSATETYCRTENDVPGDNRPPQGNNDGPPPQGGGG